LKPRKHREKHRTHRVGWLRAAVMGANDGIVSTASLLVGVAAAQASHEGLILTGAAGLVAGAMSMAAGEYVSVSSQADTENADLEREALELETDPEHEHKELAGIYEGRGLHPGLASQVAEQLMDHDALAAHARDELGISSVIRARPLQAALTSALTFSIGAALPLLVTIVSPLTAVVPAVSATSLVFLAGLGAMAARTGGAGMVKGAARVTLWGALAMAATAAIGSFFDGAL